MLVFAVRSGSLGTTVLSGFDPFDDSVLFELSWAGDASNLILQESQTVLVHTSQKELYRCVLPTLIEGDASENVAAEDVQGSPVGHLSALFGSGECSYLIEGYWNYELCHGVQLRQFHEVRDKENNLIKVDEFILGRYDEEMPPSPLTDTPPLWHFNGQDYPYYPVNMEDGTLCDLRSEMPRRSTVLYLCDEKHGELPTLFQVKEGSTCEYQAVVMTKQLCQHKAFRPKMKSTNKIACYTENNSPQRPLSLVKHEQSLEKLVGLPDSKQDGSDGAKGQTGGGTKKTQGLRKQETTIPVDEQFIRGFLLGEFCVQSRSSGWWQHELCYGDHVKQVHYSKATVQQKILLGVWDEEEHRKWYAKTTRKKSSTNHVTHLYVRGDICDVTGEERQCLVKLKCIKNAKPSQVSIFLEEPSSCNYIMTVEASYICDLLKYVDADGIIQWPQLRTGGDHATSTSTPAEQEEPSPVPQQGQPPK